MSENGRQRSEGDRVTGIEGRRALVTGAGSGIGLAIGRRLTSLGARLVVSDVDGPALEAAGAELSAEDTVVADLSNREDVLGLAARAGAVDVLVNNAGFQHVSPIESFPEDTWDRLLAVMLTAPFLLTKAVLPSMYEVGWGRVVNIASVHGLVASPYKVAYVAAKHGLIGLTKTTALEAASRCPDVTVHAVCPSYVRTPLVEAQVAAQADAHGIAASTVVSDVLLEANAVKRLIEPDDVADAVCFLCGPAAWSMTGAVLTMDAGWLAH